MSPSIDLGLEFNAAEEQDKKDRKPLTPGVYTLNCVGVEMKESKKGRPQMVFNFETAGNSDPSTNGKKFLRYCPLPHDGNRSGIGFLIDVTKALGKPWVGSSINTEDYLGLQCQANIADGKPNDSGQVYSEIKSFV